MKAGLIPISILIFFIFFIPKYFAQVPLNGFLRFQEFETSTGNEKLFSTDLNGDGFRDLIAYNPSENKYSTLNYDGRVKRFINSSRFSPLIFTSIKSAGAENNSGKKIIFASRKSRAAGYLLLSKTGSASIGLKYKFNSYPNNIDAADIDNDRRVEILVSGPSFTGFSILSESKGRLIENNFEGKNTFSFSSFIDLDYDDYEDIAAVNLNTNSLDLFYNDQVGGFSGQRSVKLDGIISGFEISDVNLDGFKDIVLLKNKNVEVLLGDSVSTFNKKLEVNMNHNVDKYSIFDFNGDGYNDFAFLNIEQGILSIAFAENAFRFFNPVIYFKRKGIVDLNSFVDRGGRKLAVLDKNGKIYLIDKAAGFNNNDSFCAGISFDLIGSFDYMNDGSPDFYVTDNENNLLKILLSARKNLFDKYYSVKLSQKYSNIVVDDSKKMEKIFYCYSNGERLIEIIRVNFSDNDIKRRILYADMPIDDFKLEEDQTKKRKALSLLLNDKGKLFHQSFEFRDIRYLKSSLDSIAVKAESSIQSQNYDNDIYFFTRYDNTLYLNKTSLKPGKNEYVNLSSLNLSQSKKIKSRLIYLTGKSANDEMLVSIFSIDGNTSLNIYKRGSENTITIDDFEINGQTKHYNVKNGNVLYLYDKNTGKLKKLFLGKNTTNGNAQDVFESQNINSYIVAPINDKMDILIYTDTAGNLINFKTIL